MRRYCGPSVSVDTWFTKCGCFIFLFTSYLYFYKRPQVQITVNRERFAGPNFRGFCSFEEDRKNFSVNILHECLCLVDIIIIIIINAGKPTSRSVGNLCPQPEMYTYTLVNYITITYTWLCSL